MGEVVELSVVLGLLIIALTDSALIYLVKRKTILS